MSSRKRPPNKASPDKLPERVRVGNDELEVVMEIEYTTPGTALDDLLRREQAAAVLALLQSHANQADRRPDGGS